jgi:hypothetical protein
VGAGDAALPDAAGAAICQFLIIRSSIVDSLAIVDLRSMIENDNGLRQRHTITNQESQINNDSQATDRQINN